MGASQAPKAGSIPATRSTHQVRYADEGGMKGETPVGVRTFIHWRGASLAQLVEQCFRKAEVPSSTLGTGSRENHSCKGVVFVLSEN